MNLLPIKYILAGGSSSPKLRPQGKARAAGLNNPSNLKILGGTARGRRLDSPEVYLRPMMGKVREVCTVVMLEVCFDFFLQKEYFSHNMIICFRSV